MGNKINKKGKELESRLLWVKRAESFVLFVIYIKILNKKNHLNYLVQQEELEGQ